MATDINARNEQVISRLKDGATWRQLKNEFGVSTASIQLCLKDYLKDNMILYGNLLAVAKTNAQMLYIDIAETGALLHSPTLLESVRRIYVPSFCKDEIIKMAPESEMLTDQKICWSNIHWDRLHSLPFILVKKRSISMAAFCSTMARRNKEYVVRVHTTSKEIAELLELQKFPNIRVVMY